MTREDKDLLLKDLCGRLPYKVMAQYYDSECESETWDEIKGIESSGHVDIGQYILPIEKIKPYLYPMSSMTEEQSKTYHELVSGMFETSTLINFEVLTDFFHKNHLDYRGLIPMGLAIDATGLNIY